jgi:transcriptional regulator with XRE-family HTH domain
MMSQKSPSEVDKYVGNRIRTRRMLIGMSQEKLGNLLGLTFQQVQKYEKGINRVSASRLLEIGDVLSVPMSFFFDGWSGDSPGQQEGRASWLNDILSTTEGVELIHAFNEIKSPAMRRALVDIAHSVAALSVMNAPSPEPHAEAIRA